MSACCHGGLKFGFVAALAAGIGLAGFFVGQRSGPAGASQGAARPVAMEQPGDPEAMMAAWMATMNPGPNHEHMKVFEGSWSAKIRHWEMGADAPMDSTGEMTTIWIHGGRYLRSEYSGSMKWEPEGDDVPFTGTSLQGFNNITKEYESVWIDSVGTGIHMTKGTFDPASRTFTHKGEMLMPMPEGGSMTIPSRDVTKIVSNDVYVMTMYHDMGEDIGEYKAMEITFTRKK